MNKDTKEQLEFRVKYEASGFELSLVGSINANGSPYENALYEAAQSAYIYYRQLGNIEQAGYYFNEGIKSLENRPTTKESKINQSFLFDLFFDYLRVKEFDKAKILANSFVNTITNEHENVCFEYSKALIYLFLGDKYQAKMQLPAINIEASVKSRKVLNKSHLLAVEALIEGSEAKLKEAIDLMLDEHFKIGNRKWSMLRNLARAQFCIKADDIKCLAEYLGYTNIDYFEKSKRTMKIDTQIKSESPDIIQEVTMPLEANLIGFYLDGSDFMKSEL